MLSFNLISVVEKEATLLAMATLFGCSIIAPVVFLILKSPVWLALPINWTVVVPNAPNTKLAYVVDGGKESPLSINPVPAVSHFDTTPEVPVPVTVPVLFVKGKSLTNPLLTICVPLASAYPIWDPVGIVLL